jgi:hypothetical protein
VFLKGRGFEATIESLLLAGGPDEPETSRSLREHRAAFISPVVTGKVMVKDEVGEI